MQKEAKVQLEKGFDWQDQDIADEAMLLIELPEQLSMSTSGEVVKLHETRTVAMSKQLYEDTIKAITLDQKQRKENNMPPSTHPLISAKVLDVAIEVPVKGRDGWYRSKTVGKSDLSEADKKALEDFENKK